jgi:hypothetical protein
MGKGSRARRLAVPKAVFDNNFENIFGKKPPKEQWVPPPLVLKEEPKKQGITFNKETKDAS